jgi:2-polyprenyl-3-methyl-5-hydroxy-6-metoxy-1,4-benzoquinol methylase
MLTRLTQRLIRIRDRMYGIEPKVVSQEIHLDDEELKQNAKQAEKDLKYSAANQDSMADWWERAHQKNEQLWITGSSGQQVWQCLDIKDQLVPGTKVLNVGVGTGTCTRELADLKLTVHALDISKTALARVKEIATVWTPDKLAKLPQNYFDLAISFLVAQHMADPELQDQIKWICKALTPIGIYAVQFAQNDQDQSIPNQSLVTQKTGGVLRNSQEIKKLVTRAGGKIKRMWVGPTYKQYHSRWMYVWIGK